LDSIQSWKRYNIQLPPLIDELQAAMPISLRQATPQDGQIIHQLIGQLAQRLNDVEKFESSPDDFMAGLSAAPPAFAAIIAEEDGDPVGICLFFPSFSSWRGTPGIYVQDLFVAEQARGSGLGRQLLGYVATLGRERGAGYIRLAVEADNEGAQGFYEKMGMRWAETDRIFVIDGDAFQSLSTS